MQALDGQTIKFASWYALAHFDLAALEALVKQYSAAIAEMQRYVDLEPNAPDARDAKDMMYKWEVAVKQ